MADQRFTESGDDRLEADIAAMLAEVAGRAATIPGVQAVLLGGSLGRGEGTVRRTADGDELASDVEIFLVGADRGLRRAAERLSREAGGAAGADLSAAWLDADALRLGRAKNLSRRPSKTIRLYELEAGSRLLHGRLPEILHVEPAQIPVAEGVREILNRLAEAAPQLAAGSADVQRWSDKLLMACGNTLLLASGGYAASYRERWRRLADVESDWALPPTWRLRVRDAYARKLDPTGGEVEMPPTDEVAEISRAFLAASVPVAAGISLEPIRTFPERYVVAAARREELLRYLPPAGPAATYEGLIVLLRILRARWPLAGRAIWQALLGRPLSLWLQAAAAPLYVGIAQQRADLIESARAALLAAGLPRRRVDGATTPVALATLLRGYWQLSA